MTLSLEERFRRELEAERAKYLMSRGLGLLAVITLAAAALLIALGYFGVAVPTRLSPRTEIFIVGMGVGAIGCYIVARLIVDRYLERLSVHFSASRIPGWSGLRRIGSDNLKRVSFAVMAFVPLCAYVVTSNPLQMALLNGASLPLGMKLSFFASFLIVAGASIASAAAPRPDEDPSDPEADRSRDLARGLCWFCYLNAFWLAVVISLRSALLVIGA